MASDRTRVTPSARRQAGPLATPVDGFAVTLESVRKSYGAHTVVSDVSLGVEPGTILALLGPNGAGKTTLLKLILGLVRPGGGEVHVAGTDPQSTGFQDLRGAIGFLPENVAFQGAMTGNDVLKFYASLKGVPRTDCVKLLERVGLADAATQRVGTYSKGMRQRLGLAQALLGRPRLLLLDEPMTGLDPHLRRQFFDIIASLRDAGVTIIISSHALAEIESHADHYAILCRGELAAHGTLADLRERSNLPVRALIKADRADARALLRFFDGRYKVSGLRDGRMAIACPHEDKMALIHEISILNVTIEDIEIRAPRLDEIFAYFTSEDVL